MSHAESPARIRRLGLIVGLMTIGTLNAQGQNWPSFRGDGARGVADAGSPPTTWDAAKDTGIRWRARIPGLSHASPVVWGDSVYILSAVADGSTLDRTAQGVVFAKDTVQHDWRLHCLDLSSGSEKWVRSIHTGTPRQPRHVRGTYANATPVTDGRVIVVSLANEGLFGLDMEGKRLWHVPLAPSQPDASLDPASSPVIAAGAVIMQNDWKQGGFAAAYELSTGRERWRVARSEGLSWSTPGVWTPQGHSTQVIFNSPRWIRSHDAVSGQEIWRLNNAVESPWDRVPTPVPSGGLLFVGGGGTQGPLLAVRSSAAGELQTKSAEPSPIAWRVDRAAPYLSTPLVYRGLVFVIGDTGILSVYRESDGSMVHRTRLSSDAGTLSASPVAAGGRVYFSSQDGDVFVISAGETFELLARNPMGESIFATPAIAGDTLIVRTASGVYGIGRR